MKLSKLATKTIKEAPADEQALNAQLLIRAGYIHKEVAGVYDFLPLGWMVLNNIMRVIREEMNAIDGQELFMSSLQNPAPWIKSGRWPNEAMDIWFKTLLQNGNELGLGNTHEEPLTSLMCNHIQSYKDLPKFVYQFQTKFRNELRAKSGIMRTREFIMKDLYSFCATLKDHEEYYERAKQAYTKIFDRLGIGESTYLTFASGGSFSKYSHEFQVLCSAGEDTIYIHEDKKIAINKEVLNDNVLIDLDLNRDELIEKSGAEVGNIFSLGTRFSEPLGLYYINDQGQRLPVIMGSYGIGPARIMGVIVELMSDESGLIWPETIAPFKYHLIGIGSDESIQKAREIYDKLSKIGLSVIYDDRDIRAGEKFADADLLGMPIRLVVSDKTGNQVEQKLRTSKQTTLVPIESITKDE